MAISETNMHMCVRADRCVTKRKHHCRTYVLYTQFQWRLFILWINVNLFI